MSNKFDIALETLDEVKKQAPSEEPITAVTSDVSNTAQAESDETVTMSGPLSEVYTKALQVIYAKNTNPDRFVMESQANDAIMNAAIAEHYKRNAADSDWQSTGVVEVQELGNASGTDKFIYAMQPQDVTYDTLKEISGQAALLNYNKPDTEVIMVIDGSTKPFDKVNAYSEIIGNTPLVEAIEQFCDKYNVQVCFGFEALMNVLKKK